MVQSWKLATSLDCLLNHREFKKAISQKIILVFSAVKIWHIPTYTSSLIPRQQYKMEMRNWSLEKQYTNLVTTANPEVSWISNSQNYCSLKKQCALTLFIKKQGLPLTVKWFLVIKLLKWLKPKCQSKLSSCISSGLFNVLEAFRFMETRARMLIIEKKNLNHILYMKTKASVANPD